MIARILGLSVRARWAVAFLTFLVVLFGAWQITLLPIDAVPDVTNRQVQINSFVPTLGPVDMEKQVTFPVETALAGIPGLQMTRSLTRNGFSQVTAVFKDSTDIYFARQQVTERVAQAKDSLPAGVQPQLAPLTTGLGEIFMFDGKGVKVVDGQPGWQSDGAYLTPEGEKLTTVVAKAAYLRTVQDWIIRPQMRTVQGVAGVDSNGGYVKQYVVEPNLTALASYGVSVTDLADALERSNLSAGSNYVRRAGESFLVRADARLRSGRVDGRTSSLRRHRGSGDRHACRRPGAREGRRPGRHRGRGADRIWQRRRVGSSHLDDFDAHWREQSHRCQSRRRQAGRNQQDVAAGRCRKPSL